MTDYKPVNLSTNLVEELEDIAKSKNTDIDNTVKLLLIENQELKNPSYLTTTKVSQNKTTFSSVIPAPIKNKFNLTKGQVLYWDIEENKIIITPEVKGEDLPETPSINAGGDILRDVIFNNNNKYGIQAKDIIRGLDKSEPLNYFMEDYKASNDKDQEAYKNIILYLLDQPLEPQKLDTLQEILKEIDTLDK